MLLNFLKHIYNGILSIVSTRHRILYTIKREKEKQSFIIKNEPLFYKNKYKNGFVYSDAPNLGHGFYLNLKNESKVIFDSGFNARGNFSIIGRDKGTVSIGKNVFFNLGCSISCLDSVIIGNDVLFGEGVKIYDHNHEYKNLEELINSQGMSTGKIKIGNNCWIGTNVVILKNVTIGDNAVVGSGCIIYKDIPSNSIVTNQQNLNIKLKGQ
jgi:acetyltransferase-like isoleucine patch superfamily enzyme